MSKYDDPNEPDLAHRMARAVPDKMMADLVADGRKASPSNPWPHQTESQPRTQVEAPTYVQWAALRGFGPQTFERARAMYLTQLSQGKDPGPVLERPVWRDGGWVDTGTGTSDAPKAKGANGWYEPKKLDDWRPPGLAVMEQGMAQEDRQWRAQRKKELGEG